MRALLLGLAASAAVAATPPAPPAGALQAPRPRAPIPTDAQCLALGQVMSPLPFGPGETLEFDIDALGAKAGTMKMQTLPLRAGVLPLEVTVETNTFFSKVRRVKGLARSELSPKTLRPLRYFEDAQEDDIHRVADVSFSRRRVARLQSTVGGRTWTEDLPFGNDVSDVASAVHLLRGLPLREGQSLCFDVYGIRRIWRVWGKVLPREHVALPGVGEFESWHLAGEAAWLGLPDFRREVHIWVSDDARRLPLGALGMLDLGAVRATLKAVARPGERSTRADNKADIKW